MRLLKIFFVIVAYLHSITCSAEYYVAPMLKASWQVTGSKTSCHLSQTIPFYGSADFIHQAGKVLQFSIQEQRNKPRIVKASLTTMPAPWIHRYASRPAYLVYLDQPVEIGAYGRLAVFGEAAETMLDALLQGQFPTFTYVRSAMDLDIVESTVGVSAVRFYEVYDEFVKCRNNLLPFGMHNFQNKVFYFKPYSERLSGYAFNEIKKIARFLKEEKNKKVVIGSVTATMGKADKKWFAKRAGEVVKALTANGIDKSRVTVRAHIQAANNDDEVYIHLFGPDSLLWFFYRKGNTNLTAGEQRRLDLLAKYVLEFYRRGNLVINSHTDSKGPRARNKAISQQRGDVIKRYLISKGISAKNIKVKAYGESKPATSNRFPRGRAKNRRVVIQLAG
jgi:sodium-type flagellar protein MotY